MRWKKKTVVTGPTGELYGAHISFHVVTVTVAVVDLANPSGRSGMIDP
jgi:hypothetical protein